MNYFPTSLVVPPETIEAHSAAYEATFGVMAIGEEIAARRDPIADPRWLIATMAHPRPDDPEVCATLLAQAINSRELRGWGDLGLPEAHDVKSGDQFFTWLLRGQRELIVDILCSTPEAPHVAASALVEAVAVKSAYDIREGFPMPLFSTAWKRPRWLYEISLFYGRRFTAHSSIAEEYQLANATLWECDDTPLSSPQTPVRRTIRLGLPFFKGNGPRQRAPEREIAKTPLPSARNTPWSKSVFQSVTEYRRARPRFATKRSPPLSNPNAVNSVRLDWARAEDDGDPS